jgi:hypothetical protein
MAALRWAQLDTLAGVPVRCRTRSALVWVPHESAAAVVVGPWLDQAPPGWGPQFGNGLLYGDFARRVLRFAQVDTRQDTVTNTVTVARALPAALVSFAFTPAGGCISSSTPAFSRRPAGPAFPDRPAPRDSGPGRKGPASAPK